MRKLFPFVSATVIVLTLLIAGRSSTSAHYSYGYHGKDFASINDDHSAITICDRERDGHYAYVKVVIGGSYVITERDGGDAGCDTFHPGPVFFSDIYVCEEKKGCNRFH
jgi:hypothetical protein